MKTRDRKTGLKGIFFRKTIKSLLLFFLIFLFVGSNSVLADISVTTAGPGGQPSQTLPDAGGAFDLTVPLNKNAVNTIMVTAVDRFGHKASKEILVTQVSLDSIVVSQVTTERLSVEQVTQLVNEGVIKLDDPANYNVSKFDIVLTIANQPVSVSVPIVVAKQEEEKGGYEVYRMPSGDGTNGGRPPNAPPVEIVIFEKPIPSLPGQPKLSIPGVIIIEGKIKSLKEFYNVRLLLMNTSGIFTLKDVVANIEFPDGGLTKILPADGINSFGNILPGDGGKPGQVEKQFTIRGDEIGIRHITVNFGGTVIGPGIPEDKAIPFNGSASTEVEVKGPPTFLVKVTHPDSVTLDVPYELKVDITNTSDIPAMYASLALDVGADAQLVKCEATPDGQGDVELQCLPIKGSDVRSFGHILPGKSVSEVFTINPQRSGVISSCVAASDQNITLQVLVGAIGCVVGTFPPVHGVPDGIPTVTVLPVANAFGVGADTPVTAFFSEKMDTGSITTGTEGSFTVRDKGNNSLPGQLRFVEVDNKTVAVWQIMGGLAGNTEYTVVLKKEIRDLQGSSFFNEWTSRFTTTAMGPDDQTLPTVTLSVEPPVNPNFVLPGQIVKINAYASDQGSGISRVELRIKDLDVPGTLFSLVDQKTAFQGDLPPYIFSVNSANLVGGHTYQLMATAYDKMGNAQNATISLVIAVSSAPPTVTLPNDLPAEVLQGISVSLTPQLTGGVIEVRYYLDGSGVPYKTVNLAPYQAGLGTLNLLLGSHTIRVVAEDGLHQTGEATYPFTLLTNINMPVVNLPGLVNGAQYVTGSSFTVRPDAFDPLGIKSVALYLDGVQIATGTDPVSINTASLSQGGVIHTVAVLAYNNLNVPNDLNDAASFRTFTVVPLPNGPAPSPPTITNVSFPVNGQVTVAGTAVAGARVDITNPILNITMTTYANSGGVFSTILPGEVGQIINALQYDFNTSQSPSPATTASVQAPPVLQSIAASPSIRNFSVANAYQDISLTGYYDNGSSANITSSASFSSSNPAVASVNNAGRVVALSTGNAVITASVLGFQTQVQVTVAIVTLTGITVDPQAVNLVALGQTQQLAVTGQYTDGLTTWTEPLTTGITYVTGNPAIATVSASGLISARANGSTQISVSRSGLPALAVEVTVNTGTDPAPTVQILNPANGTQVERGQMVSISTRAQDAIGGVTRVNLSVTGQTTYSEIRQVSPTSLSTTQTFFFSVANSAAIGGTIVVNLTAEDTGGNSSSLASVTLNVVDQTAPVVAITTPGNQARFNYGDTVTVTISASDAVGVTELRYETTGAVTASGTQAFPTGTLSANASFSFTIPFGIQNPDVRIVAYVRDAAGNERASLPVDIIITDADIVSSSTRVTGVVISNGSAIGIVTYEVLSGLSDLDHVELYFRRNGMGTFNRYTDADHGNLQGFFTPEAGNIGIISFDSTKMGGDGTYEFYTIGVDWAGNREPIPMSIPAVPTDYQGLMAYYPFNGNALDESGTGNDGTVNGAALAEDRFNQPGRALQFNGSDNYVAIGNPVPASLQLQNELTLAAWIYVSQYPASNTLGMIVGCQKESPASGYSIFLDGRTSPDGQPAPAGHLHFQIGNGSWHTTNANAQIPLNQWVQVTATRRANEGAKIYYNGVLQPSTSLAWTGSITYSDAELDIGRQSSNNRYFNGLIDDVVIYDRALSEVEVAGLVSHFVPDQTATFSAGTIWTTINVPTVIGEGDLTLENQNIRVTGTTLTVNGPHTFQNMELLNGGVLTHSDTTALQEFRLDLNAWTVSVDATSSINVTGKGYLGGKAYSEQGRTLGNIYGGTIGTGGSYGGLGGGYEGRAPNNVYGYLTDPEELGSGGGAWYDRDGGDGGGLIKIHAVNILNDGVISAGGGESDGEAAGDGSGGGINITTTTISGAGAIRANGGGNNNGVGAGGGRIALTNTDMTTLESEKVQALGGFGYYGNGANGTVVFIQQNKAELVLTGQGPSSPWIDLTIPAGYVFDSVTFRENARVIAHDTLTVTGKLIVTGNSILTHNSQNENGLIINAKTVQVDEGSSIDVTGRGYLGGKTYNETGRTLGNVSGAQVGAGGSYGGVGSGYEGRVTGPTYGDPKNPVSLGSGGGSWYDRDGGDGGGRITINASEAVIVNGIVSANGGESAGEAAGDGSGGSILIHTSRLAGTGSITAHGGGNGNGVGGGGGRIAVYCDYINPTSNLNDLYNVAAFGKTGYYDTRQTTPGTVFIKYSNQENGNLYIDAGLTDSAGNPNRTSSDSIIFTPLGFGVVGAVTENTLTTDGRVSMLPNSLTGISINPDINQTESFVIQSNTANTITVITPNENGTSFFNIAGSGKTYAGFYVFDNLYFRRGGNFMIGDLLEVMDTMLLTEYGKLTHYDAGANFISWLDLKVTNLIIDTTGSIDATGRGYLGGKAYNEQGRTVGNISGGTVGAGGSYGGLAIGYEGRASNGVYGSLTNPIDLGSGGGSWYDRDGGDGGGLIFIRAVSLENNGTIRTNGGESDGEAAGDGSGGTVNIITGSLTGTGTIEAKGGGNGNGSGGGGGRIAVTYSGSITLPEANITAIGGTGYYGSPGGNGTVYLVQQGQTYGNLIIDGFGRSTPGDSTRIPGGYTFDNLTLRNSAQVVADEGITVAGRLLVTGNSILTHGSGNEEGLVVNASVVQVEEGSSMDGSGRGYLGGKTYNQVGKTLGNIDGASVGAGGSYGGLGAGYEYRATNLVYGDPKNPISLGSGGGAWYDSDGTNGGGRITINASSKLIVNGAISVNGGNAGDAAGGGSGGSILIHTQNLSGDGVIQTNGGGVGSGVGGGGGRVAIFCNTVDTAHNLNNLYNITAFSGHGYYDTRPATAGTVYIKYTNGQDYLVIDNNVVDANGVANGTAAQSTPLTPIGFDVTSSVLENTLVTDGLVALMPNGLIGLRLNPDVTQGETFVIQSNTGNTITVVSPNENNIYFNDIAGAGNQYAGYYEFDNVIFSRGGNLVMGDPLVVTNTMNISQYGMLTHFPATLAYTSQLNLTVGHLNIDATGRIDVTGKGYLGGKDHNERGRTLGNILGSSAGAGGSYGGLGGGYIGRVSNPVYGIAANPNEPGSGGGAWDDTDGGNGGGLVLIQAGDITLNGIIRANGGESNGSAAGDGSGGGLNIVTTNLLGTGSIQADGGGQNNGVGGGGGRIAIEFTGTLSLSPGGQIHSLGGQGYYGTAGQNGTVFINGTYY